MKQDPKSKPMSPVNIDQNSAIGQDSPTEGSHMGKEAHKTQGAPGQEDPREQTERADPAREEAIRQAAYEAYLRRGGAPGNATDDWLQAEAQVDRQRRQP